jgi:hypothetical protein
MSIARCKCVGIKCQHVQFNCLLVSYIVVLQWIHSITCPTSIKTVCMKQLYLYKQIKIANRNCSTNFSIVAMDSSKFASSGVSSCLAGLDSELASMLRKRLALYWHSLQACMAPCTHACMLAQPPYMTSSNRVAV